MQEYGAYIVRPDGHILSRTEFFCAVDEAAMERAKQLIDVNDVELSQRDQRIAVPRPFAPDPEADLDTYGYVPCPACGLSHLFNKLTGRLISDDANFEQIVSTLSFK